VSTSLQYLCRHFCNSMLTSSIHLLCLFYRHGDHLDDLLGAMLDIDDIVAEVKDWIDNNGGYEKNALYVTADHDHYLTLMDHFPEVVANMIIDGMSHNITPESNTCTNAWDEAIGAGRHEDDTQSQTEHLADFSTWSDEDIQNVAHFFGPWGAGGNGWGSHSTRPIVIHHEGDDGCLDALVGKGYRVLGTDVEGSPGKLDQVHVNACMMKNLFAL
jgi:alkaline phosphatase